MNKIAYLEGYMMKKQALSADTILDAIQGVSKRLRRATTVTPITTQQMKNMSGVDIQNILPDGVSKFYNANQAKKGDKQLKNLVRLAQNSNNKEKGFKHISKELDHLPTLIKSRIGNSGYLGKERNYEGIVDLIKGYKQQVATRTSNNKFADWSDAVMHARLPNATTGLK